MVLETDLKPGQHHKNSKIDGVRKREGKSIEDLVNDHKLKQGESRKKLDRKGRSGIFSIKEIDSIKRPAIQEPKFHLSRVNCDLVARLQANM